MNDIARTIDYCKGRIKSLNQARKLLPYEKFNQRECDKITNKLHHYKLIVSELSKLNHIYEVANTAIFFNEEKDYMSALLKIRETIGDI